MSRNFVFNPMRLWCLYPQSSNGRLSGVISTGAKVIQIVFLDNKTLTEIEGGWWREGINERQFRPRDVTCILRFVLCCRQNFYIYWWRSFVVGGGLTGHDESESLPYQKKRFSVISERDQIHVCLSLLSQINVIKCDKVDIIAWSISQSTQDKFDFDMRQNKTKQLFPLQGSGGAYVGTCLLFKSWPHFLCSAIKEQINYVANNIQRLPSSKRTEPE